MNKKNTRINRHILEKWAARLDYGLRDASQHARMVAACNAESLPRWELRRDGDQWADGYIPCQSLQGVAQRLDEIEIMGSLRGENV